MKGFEVGHEGGERGGYLTGREGEVELGVVSVEVVVSRRLGE